MLDTWARELLQLSPHALRDALRNEQLSGNRNGPYEQIYRLDAKYVSAPCTG